MATITDMDIKDIRFPTSLNADGSDAIHGNPDYSCVYLTLYTDDEYTGHGFTFTLGRGNEIVLEAVKSFQPLVVGRFVNDIFDNFAGYWRELTSEQQIRWLGPEKGVVHLAVAAIVNALWDLWARMEKKPVWKLLADMEPEKLVSTIDFRYISDVLTKEEAIDILKKSKPFKSQREAEIRKKGYPAYTTSAGWLGYSDEKIKSICKDFLSRGFTGFKVKVGADIDDDIRRVSTIRRIIGEDTLLMTDANQRWDVQEAINWMHRLSGYNILWIEEPTSPDDVLGHAEIVKALKPLGIKVATGEHCQNRVMFKQFLQAGAMDYCQIDSCRIGGVNELISVYLMAAKFGVPVCPHAGGVGLCELVQHLSIFDYISITGTTDNRMIEYVDHLHEHFVDPVIEKAAKYVVPLKPGYSSEMKRESLEMFEYPNGSEWQKLFAQGTFKKS